MPAIASQPLAINPKLVVPFINSVRAVMATMAGVQTTVERPVLKGPATPSYDVSGIIGFSGDITGSVVLSFAKDTAMKLVSAFAGTAIAAESPDFADAVGELANMVAGGAKKDIGVAASISVPSVIIGPGHHVARLSGVPCLVIPCTCAFGQFAVEVNIKEAGAVASH